ncbi:TIM21-domain-containing protein [Apodospora peruviana]|uniref:Mitochondrial import inner membrane translocase subunit Tim21 n=1 Tax=Apodospora peruviana TaxID=516989 RepID=A0AAE0M532_9PEZI|nr:TIM21-domain-containing protein [Apodospora peruviana]
MMKLFPAAPGLGGLRLLRPTTTTTTATTTKTTAAVVSVHAVVANRRRHASTSNESKRRAVTPFNDDGHVPWTNLSAGEKTARATQQTFNFGMVIVGLVLTGGVSYFLYQEVLSPDSKTAYFNRAVNRIKKDPRCLELLGDPKKITAFGEETQNKWRRARPIASTVTKDSRGNEHLMMHFNVCPNPTH